MSAATPKEAEQLLNELRALLLDQDRHTREGLAQKLNELEAVLNDPEALGQRLEPILEDQVQYLQENFPELFGRYLSSAIKLQIRNSQGEIIDALYPIMGKLINRYLRAEIERISQRLDQSLKDPFSWENIKLRFKAWFSGVSYQELLLSRTDPPIVEDLFLIDKNTGLAMAHYSLHELTQPEVVAGMLTGIKSFVEHAFDQPDQELQNLEYEQFKILIFSFQTFFLAAGLKGYPSALFKQTLRDQIMRFVEEVPIRQGDALTQADQERLSQSLKNYFDEFGPSHQPEDNLVRKP